MVPSTYRPQWVADRIASNARRTGWTALSVLLVAAALAACGGETSEPSNLPAKAAVGTGPHHVRWLEISTPISPERWLASRGGPALIDSTDPEVVRIAALLEQAHRLYRESPRMIANRAVQVEGMLAEEKTTTSAVAVLEDLAGLAGEAGQTEGFGAISQHYVILHRSGLSRAAAVATLQHRYGQRQ